MKLITLANLRSGGKSSIARLLAEKLNSAILNFDKKRDSEVYNVISTINIPEDKTLERREDCLILKDKIAEQSIKTKSDYLICDLGGYFDERLIDLKSDFYIIPSFDDYESISESMRTAHLILKSNIKAKIIFVLNGAFITDKYIREEKIKEFNEHIEVNGFNRFPLLYLPKTNLMRKLVDEASKQKELKNKYEQEIKYINIDKFLDELIFNFK
ncbi:hypothetical protein [Aliarcobacter thereius]|uniref:CobQ/CobB/MinD/ParA nucleotide binding domain-containing protein n=2 Tax=Aliarcobacter thereius TaxID=544718 RepID=A0A1C0B5P8_9BACT|nr:hypothetical protein [Aliarcobacter thereius]OCL90491.1 hypothetical protein AAX25_01584 [Aliarcobacter thereius]OCL95714.1 hypothetical protein AA347_01194 [Aliarcobacter thereius LMG 24486]OCL98358.1 hypothetical protein AAX29_01595 [Aliarcobacter thereius]QBF16302.1 hypothetical protein ATH_1253 [Aliarcobacter thereius LMG 24486]TLS92077.1 hypothetical protein FE244_06635 [Aliarcobacter thereius]